MAYYKKLTSTTFTPQRQLKFLVITKNSELVICLKLFELYPYPMMQWNFYLQG